jgi:hypothetical protein
VTIRHDFIDFLFTEHLLAFFLLAGKIIDSKKVWFKYKPKIHTENGSFGASLAKKENISNTLAPSLEA